MNKTKLAIIICASSIIIFNLLSEERRDHTARYVTGQIQDAGNDVSNTAHFIADAASDIVAEARYNLSPKEFECLAKNIFYEAGVESYEGKIAVAQVTANRIGMRKSWTDICQVVYAKAQFSWTLDPKKKHKKPHGPLWRESLRAAEDFVNGATLDGLEKSDHYYATYIEKPRWAHRMTRVKKVGQHVFYAQR